MSPLLAVLLGFLPGFWAQALGQSYPCNIAPTTQPFPKYPDQNGSGDCRTYVQCITSGSTRYSVTGTCPNGLYFDKDYADCTLTPDCGPILCSTAPVGPPFQKYIDPNGSGNCKTYIQCVVTTTQRYPVTGTCPDGLYFNQAARDCALTSDCSSNILCSTATNLQKFPDPNGSGDCRTYVECIVSGTQRTAVLGTCPTGLYFNRVVGDCSLTANCGTGLIPLEN